MAQPSRTERQRRGALAEDLAADYVSALGWRVLARNVRVAADEVDLLALEPGQPDTLVLLEVRSLRSRLFGAPEERVDRAKVARLYRAAAALRSLGEIGGVCLPRVPWRVDLLVVDARGADVELRHLRALEPP